MSEKDIETMHERENKVKETNTNNPHKNHRARVRQQYIQTGFDGTPEHNLLEMLLFYSIPRKDTNVIAHKLIEEFGSLSAVFDAPYERLFQIDEIGENTAFLLTLIPALCKKYIEGNKKPKPMINTFEDVVDYMESKYYGVSIEVFYMLCLDSSGALLNCYKIAEGIPGRVLFDKRKVVEAALRNSCEKVIFVHNHPNGFAAPSMEDLTTTSNLSHILSDIGIAVADHVIIAKDDSISLASYPKFSKYFV